MNVPDKLSEWLGAAALTAFGGLCIAIRRWISMLHKHEKEIALLRQSSVQHQATNSEMLKAIGDVRDTQEQHRKESIERLDSLKDDIRDDINRIITLIRR